MDAIKISVLHAVVLISFFRFTDASNLQLLVALGYQDVASTFFFGMILIDQTPARSARRLASRHRVAT